MPHSAPSESWGLFWVKHLETGSEDLGQFSEIWHQCPGHRTIRHPIWVRGFWSPKDIRPSPAAHVPKKVALSRLHHAASTPTLPSIEDEIFIYRATALSKRGALTSCRAGPPAWETRRAHLKYLALIQRLKQWFKNNSSGWFREEEDQWGLIGLGEAF